MLALWDGDEASIASNRANNFWFDVLHPSHPRYDPTKMEGIGPFTKKMTESHFLLLGV
jgi:hypothetical protein